MSMEVSSWDLNEELATIVIAVCMLTCRDSEFLKGACCSVSRSCRDALENIVNVGSRNSESELSRACLGAWISIDQIRLQQQSPLMISPQRPCSLQKFVSQRSEKHRCL